MNATTIAITRIPPIVPAIAPTTSPVVVPPDEVGEALAAAAIPLAVAEDEGVKVTYVVPDEIPATVLLARVSEEAVPYPTLLIVTNVW